MTKMLSRDDHGFVDISALALNAAIRESLDCLDCLPCLSHLRSAVENGEVPVAHEQRKLAAILAAQLVGYLLTVKGISPSLVSTSVIVLTCQYN